MAAINVKELHVDTGSAWQRAVELWESYVVESAWTLTASVTYVDGNLCLKLIIDDATDVTTYYLIMCDTLDGTSTLASFFSMTGWRYSPGAKLATYGARTTKTDFDSKVVALRRSLIAFACTSASLGSKVNDDLSLPVLSANARISHWIWKERMNVGIDVLVCPVYTPDTDYSWYGNRVGIEGVVQPSLQIAGGGSVDLSEVVSAIGDLSFIDQTFTINNGADMFSVRGRFRVS